MKVFNKIKAGFFGLMVAGVLTLFSLPGFGQTVKTVKGEVLDLSCYMNNGDKGRGMVHKVCTIKCLQRGLPAGLLTEDGQVYLLVENHRLEEAYKTAINHGGDQVQITGKVYKKPGMQSLYVEEIKVL